VYFVFFVFLFIFYFLYFRFLTFLSAVLPFYGSQFDGLVYLSGNREINMMMITVTRCTLQHTKCSVDRWRHKVHKFAVEIFQNVKNNRSQSLCQILPMVTIEIVKLTRRTVCAALCTRV